MTLCVFALIASEFMPVSLLTPMAAELKVSEGLAGYGIAISGAFAVVTSLSISSLAGAMDRKRLLLVLTGLMCVSGLVVGMAPNYTVYMIGRALIGVVIGGFWSMSAAVAMRLVPLAQVPKALAIFNGGNALATVVAAPLGSYLGGIIGWRGAFFCLLPVALIALVWQWISLPPMQASPRTAGSGNVFSLFREPLVILGMLAVGTFFMGQSWLARALPRNAEAGGGLMVAVIQLCIALGSTIGGLLFDGGGYRISFLASAALLLLAAALAFMTSRALSPETA